MPSTLTAPFPWFGGKRRAAPLIWPRFGDVDNYVEPFAGSLAVLLQRPHAPKTETVNDRDAYVSNFWRALAADPDAVLAFADWPVSEADLHARHVWLLEQVEFRERMLTDPHFFDARIAGYWWFGVSSWIGSGWCDFDRTKSSSEERQTDRQTDRQSKVHANTEDSRTREQSGKPSRRIPHLTDRGTGVHRDSFRNSLRHEGCTHARTHARTHAVPRQLPALSYVRPLRWRDL